jgi:hypothetical protein
MAWELKDQLTFGVAVIGATLGVLNTWRGILKDRSKIRVTPQAWFTDDGESGLCIEAINLSAFDLTITQVGLAVGRKKRLAFPFYSIGDKTPILVKPRARACFYVKPGCMHNLDLRNVKGAVVITACGQLFRGDSRALKSLVRNAAKDPEGVSP